MGDTVTDVEPFHGRYDWSYISPSSAVVDAVSALESTNPVDFSNAVDTTLFDHVDPDALDALVTGDGRLSISFSFAGYRVRIDGNELVIRSDYSNRCNDLHTARDSPASADRAGR